MTRLRKLGQNIKKFREQKQWSQEFLAEKINFSREYISHIERGQKHISLRKLFLLADILEVKICNLINFD